MLELRGGRVCRWDRRLKRLLTEWLIAMGRITSRSEGREMRTQHAYLGAFDKPILRDWTFWHAVAWAVLGIPLALTPEGRVNTSIWVQAPFNIIVGFFIPGWSIAMLRRLLRLVNSRRRGSESQRRSDTLRSSPAAGGSTRGEAGNRREGRAAHRQHAYLAVFDKPIRHDWMFWHAALWGGLGIPTAFDPTAATYSAWIQVPLNVVVLFFMPGFAVALTRRFVRMAMQRYERIDQRAQVDGSPEGVSGTLSSTTAPVTNPYVPPDTVAVVAIDRPRASQSPVAPPLPLASLAGQEIHGSEFIAQAKNTYPYPVARAARGVYLANHPLEQYQNILDLAESISVCVGLVATCWLREFAPGHRALSVLYEALHQRGVSQGHWHQVATGALHGMQQGVVNAPDGFVDGMKTRPGSENLTSSLKLVLEERNRAAHGGRPQNRTEAAVRVAELLPIIERAIRHARFLVETPWALVDSASFRREDQRFNVRVGRAMGDHPDFDTHVLILDRALANETFYLLGDRWILDMTPFLVMRFCPHCRQTEVCYADRVDKSKGVSLKTVARGHQLFDQELLREFQPTNGST